MTNQPDYDFFLKLDKWTKKDAALILCGHDPAEHRNLRFNQDSLPNDLIASQKLYRIFCSVNFLKKYGRDNYPLDYILECHTKGIALPEPLLSSARAIFKHLQKARQETDDFGNTRERDYLLKIIGALASVYCKEKTRSSRTKSIKISISTVVEDTLQYIEDYELASSGLGKSNLHKKISEGIAAFDDDFQARMAQILLKTV